MDRRPPAPTFALRVEFQGKAGVDVFSNVRCRIPAPLRVGQYAVNPQFVAVKERCHSEHRRVSLVHLIYDDAKLRPVDSVTLK